jgi:hypothetical protein
VKPIKVKDEVTGYEFSKKAGHKGSGCEVE